MNAIWITLLISAASISPDNAAATTAAKVPLAGILSAFNSRGAVRYCGDKGLLNPKDTNLALSADRWPVFSDLDAKTKELAQQAEKVGKRGVLFTFTASQSGATAPSVTLEDLAASDHTTPQSLCQNLAVDGAEGPEPAE